MAVMVILVEMVIQESVVEMVSEAKEVKAVSEVMTDFQVCHSGNLAFALKGGQKKNIQVYSKFIIKL